MKKTIWGSLELRLPYYKLLKIALVLDIIIYLKYIVTTMKIQLKTKVLLFGLSEWRSPAGQKYSLHTPTRSFRLFLIFRIFEKCWSPLRIKFIHFFIWEHIDGRRPPRTDILTRISMHIYIKDRQIECFYSYFGWGLKVIYKSRSPMGFQNSLIEIETILCCPSKFFVLPHQMKI